MKLLLIVSILLFCISCGDNKYDKMLVKDVKGNIYKLEHNLGAMYFVNPISKEELQMFKVLEEKK